jgi:hypothetical protein
MNIPEAKRPTLEASRQTIVQLGLSGSIPIIPAKKGE